MITAAARPQITPADRFFLTLCLAIIAHGIVILGVTFRPEDILQPKYETMEIILVQQQSNPVKNTQFLAQANLEGGGDTEKRVSPSTPLPAPFPDQKPEITSPPAQESTPVDEASPVQDETTENEVTPEPYNNQELLTPSEEYAVDEVTESEEETASLTADEYPPEPHDLLPDVTAHIPEPETLMTVTENAPELLNTLPDVPEQSETLPDATADAPKLLKTLPDATVDVPKPPEKLPDATADVPEPPETLPDATALLALSLKIASSSAELDRKLEAQSQRPRLKFISASTKEYNYAAYMDAWRAKVERFGNLNYPDAARKNNLSGSLILDVALNADGSVNQITVRRSSGSKILDDAAIQIVKQSAPFAPFPDHIRKETDILHITRTWQFLNNIGFK